MENIPVVEPFLEEITYKRHKRKGSKEGQFEGMPVETIEYRLPVEEQVCECCSGRLHEMSKDVRREVEIVPAQVKIIEHVKIICGCRHCEKDEVILCININTPIFIRKH